MVKSGREWGRFESRNESAKLEIYESPKTLLWETDLVQEMGGGQVVPYVPARAKNELL